MQDHATELWVDELRGLSCCLVLRFIYSGDLYSAHSISTTSLLYSEAIPTQHGYCVGVSRRSTVGFRPCFLPPVSSYIRFGLRGLGARSIQSFLPYIVKG